MIKNKRLNYGNQFCQTQQIEIKLAVGYSTDTVENHQQGLAQILIRIKVQLRGQQQTQQTFNIKKISEYLINK